MSPSRSRLFSARVAAAAARYVDVRNDDHGWGAFALSDSSIVNTAEVLAILRTAGHACTDDVVVEALEFLCTAVEEHPKPRDEGGHGPYTRYVTFGLLGLSEFLAALLRTDVRRGIATCREWLVTHELEGGGWSERIGDERVSVFETSTAIIGLARLDPRGDLVMRAVEALLALRRGAAFPVNTEEREPSLPHTALATIALYVAGHKAEALAAARWLERRPSRWAVDFDEDGNVPGDPWRHMTFALVLRALVITGAVPADAPVLQQTIGLLNSLWSASANEWLDGALRHTTTSVRGSYAAVLAQRALARAAGAAAVDDLGRFAQAEENSAGDGPAHSEQPPRMTILDDDRVTLRLASGEEVELNFPPSEWWAIDQLARSEGKAMIATLAEAQGITAESMGTRLRRLNRQVREHTSLERLVSISRGVARLRVAGIDRATEA